MIGAAIALTATVASIVPGAPTTSDVTAIAIVVGSNVPPHAGVEPLRYADDDAIQNARTLALLGAEVELLVSPDAETRELLPSPRPAAPATRAALEAAFDRAAARVRAARSVRRATRVYVFFAGHGDDAAGRPFLQLEDGRLLREDLALALARVAADENHIVIDACRASQFVGTRGPGGEREPLAPGFSERAGPAWPPRTGFLTARSLGGQTHEWTEYQGGIFSHEVRSGLLGAADVDRDGRVTYRELGAFVARANAAIANRKYRPELVTIAPAGALDATIAELPTGPLLLEVDAPATGRAFVESETGVRVADWHAGHDTPIALRLPIDLGVLYLQTEDPRTEYRITPARGRTSVTSLVAAAPRARARGAAHEAFRRLFSWPLDADVVATWQPPRSDADELVTAAPRPPSRAPWILTGAGALAVATSAGFALSARALAGDAEASDGIRRAELAPQIDRRNRVAGVVGAIGVAAIVAGLVWWWHARGELSEPP